MEIIGYDGFAAIQRETSKRGERASRVGHSFFCAPLRPVITRMRNDLSRTRANQHHALGEHTANVTHVTTKHTRTQMCRNVRLRGACASPSAYTSYCMFFCASQQPGRFAVGQHHGVLHRHNTLQQSHVKR